MPRKEQLHSTPTLRAIWKQLPLVVHLEVTHYSGQTLFSG